MQHIFSLLFIGGAPIQVKRIKIPKIKNNKNLLIGQNWVLDIYLFFITGNEFKIAIDNNKAITPPSSINYFYCYQ